MGLGGYKGPMRTMSQWQLVTVSKSINISEQMKRNFDQRTEKRLLRQEMGGHRVMSG